MIKTHSHLRGEDTEMHIMCDQVTDFLKQLQVELKFSAPI